MYMFQKTFTNKQNVSADCQDVPAICTICCISKTRCIAHKNDLCLKYHILAQGLKLTLNHRPKASDFSLGPVNLRLNKSGSLVIFNNLPTIYFFA